MGKLGSRELTAGSDVDLILLYDHDAEAEESDGEKPLHVSVYYARLTQRLMAALSSPTAEGVLYEVDMRLRPSGNQGPVATHIDAFRKYQRTQAWTWEHMALTRARPVAGDETLMCEVAAEIDAVLAMPRDADKIIGDVGEMRALIEKEKPPRDVWDLKLKPGGIIDLEFIAQTAVLTGKVAGERRSTSTAEILADLDPDFAAPSVADDLVAAHTLYSALMQLIRLCLTGEARHEDLPPGLVDLLCRTSDLPDLASTEANVDETARTVRAHFEALLRTRDGPAKRKGGQGDRADG
jgi:glutamate-ammonia-ligase adenylyltransferase